MPRKHKEDSNRMETKCAIAFRIRTMSEEQFASELKRKSVHEVEEERYEYKQGGGLGPKKSQGETKR